MMNRKMDSTPTPTGDMPTESNISKTFTERTTKVVIILILSTLFILPFFERETYKSPASSYEVGLKQLVFIHDNGDASDYDEAWEYYVDTHKAMSNPLVQLGAPGKPFWKTAEQSDFRTGEFWPETAGDYSAVYDTRLNVKIDSILNIVRTLMVCVLLGGASYYFNKDATVLVLNPLE